MKRGKFCAKTMLFKKAGNFEKIKRLKDFNQKSLKILDVGLGNAQIALQLKRLGHDVQGVDISSKCVRTAEKKGIRTKRFNIEKGLPFESKNFDLVICTDVIEHIRNMKALLKAIRRVLKEDGQLILGIPNHFDLRNRINIFLGQGIVHWDQKKYAKAYNYDHIRFLSLKDFLSLIKASNFYCSYQQYNFMGGGIVPTRFTPETFRLFLLKRFPQLFSGKFIFLLRKVKSKSVNKIFIPFTPKGL
ncbi:MAG: methyltransferase domain-containing protein [Candidatus Moranbacteria bacterium]|nr:methyltransferase domain-containing protein [Candidatus Moranbacteria bacterium]